VLKAVIDALNLPLSEGALRGTISTRTIAGTSMLVISVTYEDPILATDIANELASQLILKSPSNLTLEQEAQIEIANNQINTLTEQLDVIQAQLQQINSDLATVESDSTERERLEEQRTTLIDQLNQATANIAQFADTIASYQQRTGALDIIETATIPTNPIGSGTLNSLILSTIVGAALAAGVVLLIEYLNDAIRTTDDVTRTVALPILGVVSKFGNNGLSYPNRLITNEDLIFSQTAEEYRNLRTNVLFSSSKDKPRVFVVTSPEPQDGKSLTSANLAISFAMAELRVLLIDGDLRRPKVHTIFNIKNDVGLTTLLPTRPYEDHPDDMTDNSWKQCLNDPGIPYLRVIPSGFVPNNPSELLGSIALKRWMKIFQRDLDTDIIIFDTPPCLMVSDSVVLAANVGAEPILVYQANSTRGGVAQKAKERFVSVGLDIMGVVLNSADPRDESYYGYGYGSYSGYYQSEQSPDEVEETEKQ
jgi:capsular exopolysaccharide synthesis family protein